MQLNTLCCGTDIYDIWASCSYDSAVLIMIKLSSHVWTLICCSWVHCKGRYWYIIVLIIQWTDVVKKNKNQCLSTISVNMCMVYEWKSVLTWTQQAEKFNISFYCYLRHIFFCEYMSIYPCLFILWDFSRRSYKTIASNIRNSRISFYYSRYYCLFCPPLLEKLEKVLLVVLVTWKHRMYTCVLLFMHVLYGIYLWERENILYYDIVSFAHHLRNFKFSLHCFTCKHNMNNIQMNFCNMQ